MDLDGTYAPQSPDLSGEESLPQPHPQHQYRGSISHISPFVTPTDSKSPFNFPHSASSEAAPPQEFLQQQQQQQQQQHYQQQQAYHNPYFSNAAPTHSAMKQEHDYDDEDYQNTAAKSSASRKKIKREEGDLNGGGPAFAEGIEVRTKFPVARIKRIMQADEDVGKVAQVTPVAVSKALELFMISIITKAAEQAKQRSSKRVLATHLKQAVTSEEQFDFLTEIVSKVPDAPAPQAKHEGDSDEAMEGVKKKRAAPRRKRKEPADDF